MRYWEIVAYRSGYSCWVLPSILEVDEVIDEVQEALDEQVQMAAEITQEEYLDWEEEQSSF